MAFCLNILFDEEKASRSKEPIKSEALNNLKLVLTCPVCLGYYKQPKQLPFCSHSLCYECLLQLPLRGPRENYNGGYCDRHNCYHCSQCRGTIECPVCRTVSVLGRSGGIDKFPTNSVAQQMVELIEAQEKEARANVSNCPHIFEPNRELCPHCNSRLCESCSFVHMESLKMEAAEINEAWENEFPTSTRPHAKLESVYDSATAISSEQLQVLESKLETVVQTLGASVIAILNEKAEKILNRARTVQNGKLEKTRRSLDVAGGQDVGEAQRLKSFLKQSVLKSNLAEAAALHKTALEAKQVLVAAESLSTKFKLDVEVNSSIDIALFENLRNSEIGTLQHNFDGKNDFSW